MLKFIVKRLVWMIVTLWVVFTISFFLMRSVPGGPFDSDRQLEPEIERNMLRRYHLDEPLVQQYLRELSNVVRGDLGYPFKLPDYTVNRIISEGLPISAALGLLALAAYSLGIELVQLQLARRDRACDVTDMVDNVLGATIGFAIGLVLLPVVRPWRGREPAH